MSTRIKFVIGGGLILLVIAGLSFQNIEKMTVFFYTPQEILASPNDFEDKLIRIGALVQKGSAVWEPKKIRLSFQITEDSKRFIPVVYNGVKPDMFRDGQGVVVEGRMKGKTFYADQLLVKHSEEYKVDPNKHKDKKEYYKSMQKG